MKQDYLRWVISNTKTTWWHDSADPAELARGIERGAIGATTNPFLASVALSANKATLGQGDPGRALAERGAGEACRGPDADRGHACGRAIAAPVQGRRG